MKIKRKEVKILKQLWLQGRADNSRWYRVEDYLEKLAEIYNITTKEGDWGVNLKTREIRYV